MRPRRSTSEVLLLSLLAAPPNHLLCANETVYDNGSPNYDGGYSNGVDLSGARRTLLDDFVVPSDQEWVVSGLRHLAIWATLPPGTGTDFELIVRADNDDQPGDPLLVATTIAYSETETGRVVFSRPEYESWYEFEPISLGPGRYWIEGTVVGPENNFWLITGNGIFQGSECWTNYEDLGGLMPGSVFFGTQTDINFRLEGSVIQVDPCPADIDESGSVGFEDLIAVLSAWGPCNHPTHCPEDLDGGGVVDLADLLIILSAWGPCP